MPSLRLLTASLSLACCTLATAQTPAAAPATTPAPAQVPNWRRPDLPPPPGAVIRVNTVGFLPDAVKCATILADSSAFRVLDANTGAVVLAGPIGAPVRTAPTDTDEAVRTVDFSALKTPGRYVLDIAGVGRSEPFAVGTQVWNEPFRVVTRGMYLWRCGVAVKGEHNGRVYEHGACHLEDGLLDAIGGPEGAIRPSVGGWHDAGDYNKYIVNAGVSVGLMFKAWEHFRDRIEPVAIGLPESGKGMPDLLAELKYEFEWMFTMQAEDGRVYHKLTARNFNYWGPPDKDPSPRFYTQWGTTATADFVAMMALGARHFREFDPAYADRCLAAARKSWAFLVAHPEQHDADLTGFHTGGYGAPDPVHRLWAVAELWETTGEAAFLQDFERRAQTIELTLSGPDWGNVRDLGLGTYLTASRKEARNVGLVRHLTGSLLGQAGRIVENCRVNPHGRPFGASKADFFWGCNGSVAGQTYLLQLADRLSPKPEPAYRRTAQESLAYLFGRNFHGRSYVSGLGAKPPADMHDRRGPDWPGYLVGGPHPDARMYFDVKEDASRNEIAIHWNASLIYALAGFVEPTAK
ncbi:MAG: glycoside hydrolase family 9 protein [Opitutaceae bacterium]|nr:glycoside hydrolase family 9 protein [Opitutaceae bacterium]